MASWGFNVGKGRVVQLVAEIDANSPNAAAALIIVPMATAGTEAQGQDLDDLAAVEADANFSERATGGWARKTLTDVELALQAVDDVNNRRAVDLPGMAFGVITAGNDIVGFLVCIDFDTAAGGDANIIPLGFLDNPVSSVGSPTISTAAGDVHRAT